LLALPISGALADGVSIGAGIRTSFIDHSYDGPAADTDDFNLDSARIYISGKATEYLSLMFNTEYNTTAEGDHKIDVIDAAAQFSFGDNLNIWAGRFLPPSDRANMYGPYYANNWGVYQDGVQDGYASETTGRDDGVMYWGQFGIAKISFGVFDIPATKGSSDVLFAGRVQLDFWDPEGGYYLNGTYYGDKNLLAVGAAFQNSGSNTSSSLDFLLEKKLGNGGGFDFEAEYASYEAPSGYSGDKSDGYYGLAAYIFPAVVGVGRFQVLGKYGEATYKYTGVGDVKLKTTELDLNYVMKQFNARASLFYINSDYSGGGPTDSSQIGLGLQVQI
jgi:hypothetical protein